MTNLFSSHIKLFYAAAFMGCFFLCGCENTKEQIDVWTSNKVMVEEARNIESYLSQDGKMKAKLTAPLMLRVMTDSQYVEFPETLHCDFYDDSTKVETWLDSKYGKYFEQHNKVYLRDSVVVITLKGDTLRTPDLWWDQNTKMFYTDKYARYYGPNKLLRGGRGMTATQDLSSIIFHDPTGTFKGSEDGFLK
jgi:LPS export ABC transporter protein LptC